MMTLQQLDMNILLWIQEHLRIRCSDTILESDHFSGKCGMVLDRAGSGTAGPEKNTQDRNCSIAFPCSGISDHECTA